MKTETTGLAELAPEGAKVSASPWMRNGRIVLPNLRLRVSERILLLLLVDALLVNGALVAALAMRAGLILSAETFMEFYWLWFATLSVVWLACALFFDCYNLARAASTVDSLRNALMATAATVLIYTFIPRLTPPLQSRFLVFLFAGLAVAAIALWRLIYAKLFVQPWFVRRALVVGAGLAGQTLVRLLRKATTEPNPFRGTGYELVGFIDDRPEHAGAVVEGIPVLGTQEVLVPLAQLLHIDEVVVAITHRHTMSPELVDALLRCRELGLPVTTMSVLYERLLGRVPVDHVGTDLQAVMPMEDEAAQRLYGLLKRLLDLAVAMAGLLVLALFMPLAALVNGLSSRGPLFYRQQRVGRCGRLFWMLKFRTMVPNAEASNGAVWASARDPRVTPLGRVLRPTRLDEVPQLINVLRGEMSIIGPRPERPEFVATLAEELPFYRARHAIRPGMTGWAQVRFGYGSSVEDAKTKLEYDLYYVKNASLLLDLRIALRTVPVMLQLQGH